MGYSFGNTNKTALSIKDIKKHIGFYKEMLVILDDMFDHEKEHAYMLIFEEGYPIDKIDIIKKGSQTNESVQIDRKKIRETFNRIRDNKWDWGLTHNHPIQKEGERVLKCGVSKADIITTSMIKRVALKIAPNSTYMGHYVAVKENQNPMNKIHLIEKNFKYSKEVIKEIEDGLIK